MNKHLLKKFYKLYESITEVEHSIFPEVYIENWFVYFEDIHTRLSSLYKEFDGSEYSELECLQELMSNKWTYDTSKLSEEHRKKYERKMSKWWVLFTENWLSTNEYDNEWETCIMMNKEFHAECQYCFIPLETLDEALNHMEERGWLNTI
jgi:hypothetical protein